MISTAPIRSAELLPTSFAYVDCDVADGQTLADWRRERQAARAPRRTDRLTRLLAARWTP